MEPVQINTITCKGCSACGDVCPRHILEVEVTDKSKYAVVNSDRSRLCMYCGQCAAVCPTSSLVVSGLNPNEFGPIQSQAINDEQLLVMMKQRRSVRRYKNEPIPRKTLDRIVEAVHLAPTGTSSRTTGIIIIDESEKIKALSELTYKQYEPAHKIIIKSSRSPYSKTKGGKERLG